MLKTNPSVFAVGNEYQIMLYTENESFVWVRIGEKEYYDAANGIMRSLQNIHRVTVPAKLLNEAKEYTVCVEPLIERLPYFSKTEPVEETRYSFTPVPDENPRAFHISDAHGWIDKIVEAAENFGEVDFLIFNGDILNHSGNQEEFRNIYEISSRITKGERPVVFSRGNHDLRGLHAESFADYTPNRNGFTYYTVRLGSVWAIILDCGEDKDDSHAEYGHSVRCHPFRVIQTEYIKEVIANAESEYLSEGVKTRLVIVHNPFTQQRGEPFNIETEIYTEWANLLRENVKPNLMICGHLHNVAVNEVGCEEDKLGNPCTVVIASHRGNDDFGGIGFTFGESEISMKYTDNNGKSEDFGTVLK